MKETKQISLRQRQLIVLALCSSLWVLSGRLLAFLNDFHKDITAVLKVRWGQPRLWLLLTGWMFNRLWPQKGGGGFVTMVTSWGKASTVDTGVLGFWTELERKLFDPRVRLNWLKWTYVDQWGFCHRRNIPSSVTLCPFRARYIKVLTNIPIESRCNAILFFSISFSWYCIDSFFLLFLHAYLFQQLKDWICLN